ncbi:MAG TPA: hypothetical protein VLA12_11235, partial [Planctomycetaceae bacterium]|nr:hypothetical protein [Planctomycetaceae bacterium]
NILRGDSVARSKIYRVVLTNFSAGTKLTATIGNKRIVYEAQSSEDAADGMATLINTSAHSEFRELLAEAENNVLTISARTPGMDVFIDFSTSGSTAGAIIVTRTTAGHEIVNEVQKLKLSDGTTGGTFTYTNDFGTGPETTGNINWGASGADVKAAIVALATPTAADLDVVKISDTEWDLYWKGAFAAVEVAEGTIDGTNLTGIGGAQLTRTKIGRGLSNEVQGFQLGTGSGAWSIMISADGLLFQQWNGSGVPTAAQFKAFLETIPAIGAGNVEVYGGSTVNTFHFFVVVFTGSLAGINVPLMQVSFGEGTSNVISSTTGFSAISQGGQASSNE